MSPTNFLYGPSVCFKGDEGCEITEETQTGEKLLFEMIQLRRDHRARGDIMNVDVECDCCR